MNPQTTMEGLEFYNIVLGVLEKREPVSIKEWKLNASMLHVMGDLPAFRVDIDTPDDTHTLRIAKVEEGFRVELNGEIWDEDIVSLPVVFNQLERRLGYRKENV